MLEAVVLAGGASARMGSPKALLEAPCGQPFIARIVKTLLQAGLGSVTIVTGIHHDLIADVISRRVVRERVRCIRNPDPDRGQLSSLLVGLEAVVTADTGGLLVTLVDVPLVTVATVKRLVEVWQRTGAFIVRPHIEDANGHPVIFDRQLFDALRAAPLELGAQAVLREYADRIQGVEVVDRGCLIDIDTPEEYARFVASSHS